MRVHTVRVNRRCNQACKFCDRVDPQGSDRPSPELRSAVQQAARGGAERLRIVGGEPLLHRDILSLVQTAREHGCAEVEIETNATLIRSPRSAQALRRAGVTSLLVTLVTVNPERHLDLVSRDTSPRDVLRGIKLALDAGIEVAIRLPAAAALAPAAARIKGVSGAFPAIKRFVLAVTGAGERSLVPNQALERATLTEEIEEAHRTARRQKVTLEIDPEHPIVPCLVELSSGAKRLFSTQLRSGDGPKNQAHTACDTCAIANRCQASAQTLARVGGPREPSPVTDRAAYLRPGKSAGSRLHVLGSKHVEDFFHVNYEFGVEEARGGTSRVGIIYRCNQVCRFCELADMDSDLTPERVRAAIDQSRSRGSSRLILTGGEPTLSPHLRDYIDHAREGGFTEIWIQSNAVRLAKPGAAADLRSAGLTHAQISLHGPDAEVSDRLTAAPGTHAKTLLGIDALLEQGVTVLFNHLIFRDNCDLLERFVEMVDSRWSAHKDQLVIQFHSPRDEFPDKDEARKHVPRYREYAQQLKAAVDRGRELGYDVRDLQDPTGIPSLCVLGADEDYLGPILEQAQRPRIHEWERGWMTRVPACWSCDAVSECMGVPEHYLALYGDEEFAPVRRQTDAEHTGDTPAPEDVPHRRLSVVGPCTPPCPDCRGCRKDLEHASPDEVIEFEGDGLLLGGGDATTWPPLARVLFENRQRERPRRLWVEAPAASLSPSVLKALQAGGVGGVVIQIEDSASTQGFDIGKGVAAVADADALGLGCTVRFAARPGSLDAIEAALPALTPRRMWLEIHAGHKGESIDPARVERFLLANPQVRFTASRRLQSGHLPPCTMPRLWAIRPTAWRHTISKHEEANNALPQCASCDLSSRCGWGDRDAISAEAKAQAAPIAGGVVPWDLTRTVFEAVPPAILTTRATQTAPVICSTPWTTMEVVDPDGLVRQCCSTWTVGNRGVVLEESLMDVWNGPGYQFARAVMSGKQPLENLCESLCSRLHDMKFAETEFRIQAGSKPFVDNQLLIAQEMAERKELVESKPLYLAICPSTYCNYDCIMCDHGRSPRRELPSSIWEQMREMLPTLRSLTLLGGEPLASPEAMRFLREFDAARYPDAAIDLITNGSLLTAKALRHMKKCTLGGVTISVNAGTPEAYEKVQRGVPLSQLLQNLDALLEFRSTHHRWFGITLSFVVQPTGAPSLVEFGELAAARDLQIRMMALNADKAQDLDFYRDPEQVALCVHHLDRFIQRFAARPDWIREARAARVALLQEAAERQAGKLLPTWEDRRHLPVLS